MKLASSKQDGLRMLERLRLAMHHHDVPFPKARFIRRVAAQNSLASDAGKRDLRSSRADFFHRAAHGPGSGRNDNGFDFFNTMLMRVLDGQRTIASDYVAQHGITARAN